MFERNVLMMNKIMNCELITGEYLIQLHTLMIWIWLVETTSKRFIMRWINWFADQNHSHLRSVRMKVPVQPASVWPTFYISDIVDSRGKLLWFDTRYSSSDIVIWRTFFHHIIVSIQPNWFNFVVVQIE